MIEVNINGVFLTQSQSSGILLKEIEGDRTLPIIIGEYEAQSIALGLENIKPPRPITHDLTSKILETCGISLESVLITELKENTFFAIIRVRSGNAAILEVDSRPSDAIALAVRNNTPIYVNESVMDQASYVTEEKEESSNRSYIFKSKTADVDRLKEELKRAVDNEEYEKAASIRDKIKQIESKS
ncbi:MAG: bifunctional nuclease family protein [Calditrichaeota bacterium]|nr:bifunctional nuclease family protein [Calditrichota bacterium]